jgi:formyl-CoA transferase
MYMAVGNDLQWRRLVEIEKFSGCATPARFSNAGRHSERESMYEDVRKVFAQYTSCELACDLTQAKIPWARVNDIYHAAELPAIRQKLTRTRSPDGQEILLQPLPVDRGEPPRELEFPPCYGQHTKQILREIGLPQSRIEQLIDAGAIHQAKVGH